jgi:glyceraldehyde 3-phosphate dehydrogenase
VARFDNNPTTGESLGLLIEEARTNLVTYSEQFDNASWTKSGVSITANTIVSPDGKSIVMYIWYDNEYGYSHQVIRLAKYIAKVRRYTYY